MSMLATVFLTLMPHGGQRTARRNAWAAMSEGAVRARSRRDADTAMAVAEQAVDLGMRAAR